ncbi:polysaccharide deacetylase family protein [Bradyrhizobium sp. WSM 1704]|uniref:polysaccharide deacetylase family protein n=1 Tax=Bradyrhizobium semiaridum TaxID=2821404 RepID=UPI001CE28180|nr:polysaccharide deacetylase family protein [Bradyrhizobium semiaridum]MCA6122027.1 polysaccharide deacetylase family protein [Bradyrhizobium semiaridum]
MTQSATYITTSWDDGHPLDLRIAALLSKHGLTGTFYVPMTAENGTMAAAQIRDLHSAFEIGAHTIHHTVLTEVTDELAWQEIVGSKAWLEDVTGRQCSMFCPPTGAFLRSHLKMIRKAGFVGLRTVELGSLDLPRRRAGLALMPTTVQAYPHGLAAFARNAVKRMAFANLWRFLVHGRSADWSQLARSLLNKAIERGGVFHLWGHSWELRDSSQWRRLDDVLRLMRDVAGDAPNLTNAELARISSTSGLHDDAMRDRRADMGGSSDELRSDARG